jgi:hypothetical protein
MTVVAYGVDHGVERVLNVVPVPILTFNYC